MACGGSSDTLYLKVLSQALLKRASEGINKKLNLRPAGGIDKPAPFVRLAECFNNRAEKLFKVFNQMLG